MEASIRLYEPRDEDQVVALWRECSLVVPWNDPHRDIARKLSVSPEGFLVAEEAGRLVGAIMFAYDGHRGWINYLAASPDRQGTGIGRLLVEAAITRLRAQGCPKVNIQIRRTNSQVIGFYSHLGFKEDDVISMGKRLIED